MYLLKLIDLVNNQQFIINKCINTDEILNACTSIYEYTNKKHIEDLKLSYDFNKETNVINCEIFAIDSIIKKGYLYNSPGTKKKIYYTVETLPIHDELTSFITNDNGNSNNSCNTEINYGTGYAPNIISHGLGAFNIYASELKNQMLKPNCGLKKVHWD